MATHEWRRGGRIKSIGEILQRVTRDVAPATAARSGDGSVDRVREYLSGPQHLRALSGMTPYAAVDRLLVVAGFNDKARNQRLKWSRLIASRLGMDAAAVVVAILADIVADGTAITVGGCLGHRLRQIAAGRPRDGLSGRVPGDVLELLKTAFPGNERN